MLAVYALKILQISLLFSWSHHGEAVSICKEMLDKAADAISGFNDITRSFLGLQ
jgi:hypothetical protein